MIGRIGTILSRQKSFQLMSIVSRRKMSLLLNKSLVNGEWISSLNSEQMSVLNPSNSAIVGHVPDCTIVEVQSAIDAAYNTFHSDEWSALTAKERSVLLKVSSCLQS